MTFGYVNAIRRITKIDEAIDRAPNADKFDDILDKLFDKRDTLVASIKAYIKTPVRNDSTFFQSGVRRKQVRLACKLLGVDYHRVVR